MAQHKQEVRVVSAGAPVNEDRATLIISGHYQEWSPSNTTHVRYAFDRLMAPENIPFQAPQRINPGVRVPVNTGHLEPGRCELILGHNFITIPQGSSGGAMLQEAQKANTIRIFNADGYEIGVIHPNRACMMHFTGQLFAECTSATAFLHVTAFPA